MVWNKLFHKSKSSNTPSSNTSNCIASCSGGGSGDTVSDVSLPGGPLSLPNTPKLKKKTKLKSVFSSLTLRSSSSASKKSIIAQNSIFNDAAATILNDNNIIVSDDVDDVTKSRAGAIVEDKFITTTGSIKDDDDHRLVNRISSHESSSSPTPPPIPPPPSHRAVGGGNYNDAHIITTPPDLSLHPCPICARTFIPVTLAKHVGICEKMTQKKRKKFDSSRQRREGTDLALLPPKPEHIKITPTKSVPTGTPMQKKKSSEHIVHHHHPQQQQQQHQQTAQQAAPINERRDSIPARLEHIATAPPKMVKRSLGPVTDQCPHCERFFGIKAYERHVEWCKEKSRISVGNNNNNSSTIVAKERLQARTKYRAPPLKTKRGANREKYSGFSGDDMSTNSLSEFQISPTIKVSNSNLLNSKQDHKQSLQNSMTSSTTSEGALSDSYDPFLSAKRQLEELFSPTNTSTPTTNNTNKNYTQPTSSSMSRSVNLSTVKSNFKRTSSLRLPKTNISNLKSVNNLFSNKKPTIQRGISVDDGPISSSFLKSSEFDEMPVKAAFVTPITPHRTIQMRDPNSVRGRKNIKNLNKTENELSKTDSLAVFLKYEHELSMNPSLTEKEIKDKNNSFSKRLSNISQSSSNNSNDNLNNSSSKMTTSLTSGIDPKLINLCDNLPINLTKLSDNDASSTSDSTIDFNFSSKIEINSLDNSTTSNKTNSDSNNNNSNNRSSTESRRLKRSLKLSKENFLFDSSSDNTNNNDINNSNSNDSDQHSNKDEHLHQIEPISNDDLNKDVVAVTNNNNNNNNSNNSIKLTTDKLFDDFDLDEFISSFEDDVNFPIFKDYKEYIRQTNTNTKTNSNNNNISNLTFRASKENLNNNNNNNNSNDVENELSKLIKQIQISNNGVASYTSCFVNDNNNNNIDQIDNAEIIRNHNNNKQVTIIDNGSVDMDHNIDGDDDDEEIMSPQSVKKELGDFTDAEKELLRSVNELDRLCGSTTSTSYNRGGGSGGADSDEVSSVESFPLSGNTKSGSKLSADSAYGSLSRHSPEEPILRQARNPLQRTRQYQGNNNNSITNNNNNGLSNTNSNTSITLEKISSTKLHGIPLNNNRIISSQTPSPKYNPERNLSSSESETSLPPLYARKIELSPNPTTHQIHQRGDRGDSVSPDCKLSKFCHECGSKFVMATAKFCMECGVKRMLLE